MTPREFLDLLKHRDHARDELVVWRDPDGSHYQLSEVWHGGRYEAEGYHPVCEMAELCRQFAELSDVGVKRGSALWQLMEDVHRQKD